MPRSTINGTAIDLDGKEMILDADQDTTITVDTDDQIDIKIGGTDVATFTNSSSDFVVTQAVQDKDIIFKGDDNGSPVTALTLDMSEAGDALFNNDVVMGSTGKLRSSGDTDSYLQFNQANTLRAVIGDSTRMIFNTGDTVFNEDSADVDFRVESNNNANMLVIDGGNDIASIGRAVNSSSTLAIQNKDDNNNNAIDVYNDNGNRTFSIQQNTSGDAQFKAFKNDGTQTFTLDGGGNVGIGTTSPDGRADIAQDQNTTKFTSPHLALTATDTTNTTGFTGISYAASTLTNYGWTVGALRATSGSNSAFLFTQHNNSASGTERMRIDGTGRLFVNTSGAEPSSSQAGVRISGIDGENFFKSATTQTSGYDQLLFINGNGNVGSISTSGSATSYNTTSDYRLKENVVTDYDATTRLKQLKPSRFNFKADKDTIVDGFLAHEVSSIVPEAVTGTKDGVDTDGNPVYQGIDQSKLVPLLTKALQESIARADALEARIKKLEGS
jgi:hypothetical protein